MTDPADARFMGAAIAYGARGLGRVWPNPAVGCLIVKDGRVISRGRTEIGGRPHAEVRALERAGPAARGATAYVSLEPCAHYGKTPPCAEALIDAGVARVVVPVEDPDPRVAGRGIGKLRTAGIDVEIGVGQSLAEDVHKGFFTLIRHGRPAVTLKLATSFDGRIATATGESRWITGDAARRRVHALRLSHDAVLVGGGTARADDPDLTVRGFGPVRQPVRIVAARQLDLPADGRLATSARDVPLWLVHGARDIDPDRRAMWEGLRADLIGVPVGPGSRIDPAAMLSALGERGLTRVFCEGGGTLASSLLNAGLVDEILGFQAGLILGAEGRPAIGAMGVDVLAEAPRFQLARAEPVGADVLTRWVRT
ncbi:MAG: bifunctional diaminohydroxyphosphoribosylaminopyrimidine deaminase/5-amino-6-(5-phosphoribosylamino)uracil reductase RibD [Pseudomonadota bacterium]